MYVVRVSKICVKCRKVFFTQPLLIDRSSAKACLNWIRNLSNANAIKMALLTFEMKCSSCLVRKKFCIIFKSGKLLHFACFFNKLKNVYWLIEHKHYVTTLECKYGKLFGVLAEAIIQQTLTVFLMLLVFFWMTGELRFGCTHYYSLLSLLCPLTTRTLLCIDNLMRHFWKLFFIHFVCNKII